MAKHTFPDDLDNAPAESRPVRKPRRASLLGMLSVLVGLTAIAVVNRDGLRDFPGKEFLYNARGKPVEPYCVAAVAAGLAVLALLLRAVTKRTRAGWPVLGLLVAAGTAGTWRYATAPMTPGSPEVVLRDNVVQPIATKIDHWRHGKPVVPQPSVDTVAPPVPVPPPIPVLPPDPTPEPPPRIDAPPVVVPPPPPASDVKPEVAKPKPAKPATKPADKKGPSVLFPELE